MQYELVTDEEFDRLPPHSEPEARFLKFEAIARRALNKIISESKSDVYDAVVRMQYMSMVAAAAEELLIPDVRFSGRSNDLDYDLSEFFLAVSRATTKLRLRSSTANTSETVRLAASTRASIKDQIDHLRTTIEQSELPKAQRVEILRRLEDILADLNQPRFAPQRTMSILSRLAFVITMGTSFLADAPDALDTIKEIGRLIWTDKAAEEAEIERLGPPPAPPAIEGPVIQARLGSSRSSYGSGAGGRPSDDMDDEIPF